MKKDLMLAALFLGLGAIGMTISPGGIDPPPPQKPGEEYKTWRHRRFEQLWLNRDE